MKKTVLKIVLATVLVLSLAIGLVSCAGANAKLPDAESASGAIDGTSITWSYSEDDNTLKINGAGDIPDSEGADKVWWHDVRHSVTKLEIAEGITSIGNYAFYYLPELESVTVPANVARLGNYAFAFCSSLGSVDLPDALTSVGEGCFEACTSLTGIFVPSNVTSVGARAFAHCSALKDAVIMAQISEVAPLTFMRCASLEKLTFYKASEEASIAFAADAFESARIDSTAASYTRSATGDVTLTVNYVNEDGTAAAQTKAVTYKPGDSYTVVSPTIEGFVADKLTVSGVISGDMTETVTYKAVEADTEAVTEAAAETEPAADEGKDGITPTTIIALVVFGVIIVAIVVLAVIMMRSDKKQAGKYNKGTGNKKK